MPNVARTLVTTMLLSFWASRNLTYQPEMSASGGCTISMYWHSASVFTSESSNSPKTLTSFIHAQPGATLSRMLYAANDAPLPRLALKSSGRYQLGISQSAAESQFVVGTVEPFV